MRIKPKVKTAPLADPNDVDIVAIQVLTKKDDLLEKLERHISRKCTDTRNDKDLRPSFPDADFVLKSLRRKKLSSVLTPSKTVMMTTTTKRSDIFWIF
jgi:hypothetical protein